MRDYTDFHGNIKGLNLFSFSYSMGLTINIFIVRRWLLNLRVQVMSMKCALFTVLSGIGGYDYSLYIRLNIFIVFC